MERLVGRTLVVLGCVVSLFLTGGDARANGVGLCDPGSQTCRTFTIENNCTYDVWVGTMGNEASCQTDSDCPTATSTCTGAQTCTCSSNTDCASTQVCDGGACRFKAPLSGGKKIAAADPPETLYLPNDNAGTQPISWGGRFWARTGCPDFTSCSVAGAACSASSDCCTNAGCEGLFTCQSNNDCSAFSCTTNSECPSGTTCDTTTSTCNGCASGTCACFQNSDCRDGGLCDLTTNRCTGQCEAGGISCQTGDCEAQLECPVGVSGQGPMTLAEFALLAGTANYDTYDVSQVNGFNVPTMIAPTVNVRPNPKTGFSNLQPWCGSPGCADATQCPGQGSACSFTSEFPDCLCDWNIDDDSCPDPLQAVWPMACTSDSDCDTGTPGSGVCDTSTVPATCVCRRDAQCPGSTTCGVNVNIKGKKRVCGTYVGCVDSDDACTADKKLKDASGTVNFSCKRFHTLYDCTGAHTGSCYTAGASDQCCGCPSWSNGGNDGPFPIADGCANANHKWKKFAQPYAEPFKKQCPTAYSFQYDDPTSTFNCSGTGKKNPVGYTITFCPSGSPGAGG